MKTNMKYVLAKAKAQGILDYFNESLEDIIDRINILDSEDELVSEELAESFKTELKASVSDIEKLLKVLDEYISAKKDFDKLDARKKEDTDEN